ncbi:MAG: hypothetical protein GX075_13540 [Firmicutes bacterium]|nr:hypothetical protein [Bacillota bacterium]
MAVESSSLSEKVAKKLVTGNLTKVGVENRIPDGIFNRIEDQNYIRSLFRNISREKESLVLIDCGNLNFYAKMIVTSFKDNSITIKTDVDIDVNILKNSKIKVSFIFKEEFINFESTLLEVINKEKFLIQKPETILSSLRRLLSRYKIKNDEIVELQISENGPFCSLLDISTKGLSFLSNEPIAENTVLSNINISFNHEVKVWVDGYVKYCIPTKNCNYLCGLSFLNASWEVFDKIFNYIYKQKYPKLKPLFNCDIEQIYNLFFDSGYLNLKPKEEMEDNFNKMANNLDKIKNRSQLSFNVAYLDNGKLFSTASLLRIYNRTFLGHQLAAIPEARMNLKTKTDIYLSLCDFLLNHPYCLYNLMYFDANSLWHNQMFKRISNYIDDKNNVLYDSIQLFEFEIKSFKNVKSKLTCKQLGDNKEFLEYCEKNIHNIEMNSYSYNDGFWLEEIKQVYELVGLFMDRKLWGIFYDEKIIAFIVTEVYFQGANLYDLLDMARIYIKDYKENAEDIIKAALPAIVPFYRRYNKEKFNVLIKIEDKAAYSINIQGLNYSHRMGRFFMSLRGLSTYKKILMLNV